MLYWWLLLLLLSHMASYGHKNMKPTVCFGCAFETQDGLLITPVHACVANDNHQPASWRVHILNILVYSGMTYIVSESILGSGLGPTACTKRLHLRPGNGSGNQKVWSKNTRMLLGKNECAKLSFDNMFSVGDQFTTKCLSKNRFSLMTSCILY